MVSNTLFTSNTEERYTPQDIYENLNSEFGFTLDPCATDDNHKCSKYFTKEIDGLSQNRDGYNVFMNPPYGRDIGKRIEKARNTNGGVRVCLVPSRTDTRWFHEHVYGKAEIRFIKGRLKFGGSKNPAPFPSMIIIYR